ncbi:MULTISPECIES: hypothetical protein [Proteiniphilum]|jgi:hypothetical protein|uniref:hypothetical protein n=1 Tax=Proteiniphilum TaxID=294702 RepID=UPI001EEC62F0|nr:MULTISPECIES: hypothetical protein [Proteiniphilum]ULB35565.1 hypothetical protein KDN43_05900 [Proteiniphilum propionicum]
MKRSIIFFFFLASIITGTLHAQKIIKGKESPLEIAHTRNIEVKWKGEILICSDSLSWITDQTVGDHADTFMVTRENGWQTVNVWNSKAVAPYRREMGLSPDSKKIELTFQVHQDALMDSYPSPDITYKILVPAATLANSTWDALTGRSQNARWSSGNFDVAMPDGIITTGTRWITFNTPKGAITFDFNPHGVGTYYVAGINTMVAQWTVAKKGDAIELSFSTSATQYGGDLTSKLTLFEGGKNDYANHHAATFYHYFSELKKEKLFSFNDRAGNDFTNAGTTRYDSGAGYGWQITKGISIEGDGRPGALYAACSSSSPNTFTTDGLRPGLYLITIKSSALHKGKGPFSIIFDGEPIYNDITINKGKMSEITLVQWIEDGNADISFAGDWAVSVIGFQLFLHREEDYQFRRGNWLKKEGFCPGILFANYYDTPPVYGKALAFSSLAGEIGESAEIPPFPDLGTALPDQQAKELAWRFNSPLGTMGPDNWGTFNEFNTPEKIKKRLEQVKNSGVNAVILNGFLSRHTYSAHLKRVEENIRQTVEIAHQKRMKIIDHQDLTILWNADMGFRFLAANPGYLQHNHTNGLPTWGLCPVNTDFKYGYFFPYISEHIKNTNIDGFMLDETAFHFANFCNCSHCRKSFTDITGLVLPDDETNPLLHNKSSKLWKTWIEWRKYAMAQWRIDLSNLTHRINPYFSNLEYYSEGGFLANSASYGQGGDLPLSARSKDFLGTEIMSRDVWDDYRYNFTSRNMYNSLRETYGSPVFGLVYPVGVFNYALIGWAMNNMFGQVTWSLVDFEENEKMNPYTGWEENMNKVTSVPYTDIAVVFSRSTRDWSAKNTGNYPKEIMGTGQFLASRHIPHTFILDDAITSQDISRFRVLLAPGMDCISDAQESILKQFIFNGGTLLLTGESGVLTPYGEVRDKRAFCDILTERLLAETTKTDLMEVKYGKGRIIYSMDKSMMNEFCPSIRDTDMIYRFTPDPKITAFNERIIENTVGTMKFKSISIPSKVLVTAYKDTEKGAVMVHLLNATGVKSKHGDVLPLAAPAWEPINEDISFEITLPSFKKAYYTSPDAEGHKKVDVEKTGKNRYKVIVPRGTVDKYGIVYLLQE